MEVRAGYKQTEVGDIPESWRVETIGNLIEEGFIVGHLDGNHGELYPRSHEFKLHGVPYIGANDFEEGGVTFNRCKYLNLDRAKQFRKGVAKDGDVLFAHNATVGPVALLRTNEPFVILSTTATYFRCNSDKLSNLYLKEALQSPQFIRQYQAVMAQSTRFQVPITAQRKLSLVIPPPKEQRAIATALSDVDALFAAQDKLIAKKRDIKQAAMQQLLTGKQRLPGFSGEWEVKRLSDVATVLKGSGLSKGKVSHAGSSQCVLYGELFTTYSRIITKVCSSTDSNEGLPSVYGDILLPGSTTTVGIDLATASALLCDGVLLGGDINVVRAKGRNYSSEFLAYLLTEEKRNQIADMAQGITIIHLYGKSLLKLELRLPSLEEQTAIATVFFDMDTDLTALEQQRDKTRALKQGMMQELLTGRIRLIPEGELNA